MAIRVTKETVTCYQVATVVRAAQESGNQQRFVDMVCGATQLMAQDFSGCEHVQLVLDIVNDAFAMVEGVSNGIEART